METQKDRQLNERVRQILSDDVPDEVESRLRSQVSSFRVDLIDSPVLRQDSLGARHHLWTRVLASCLALVAVAVVSSFLLAPSQGLAQVATAMLKQKWVHVHTTLPDGNSVDDWWSPELGITALRSSAFTRFENHRNQVYETYKPEEQSIFRSPIVGDADARRFESQFDSLRLLFQSDRVAEKQFDEMFNSGQSSQTTKILEQQVKEVTADGRKWLDYQLTVSMPSEPGDVLILFHVDAVSKLPALIRFEGQMDGKPVKREAVIEYPPKGPIDIYELNVPRTAKLIDRVPNDDLKRIANTLRADRRRMDNYRAVFINPIEGPEDWRNAFPQIFYRKGTLFRRDFIAKSLPDAAPLKEPEAGDRRAWWLDRAKQYEYYPCYVQIDTKAYHCTLKPQEPTNGGDHGEIGTVESHKFDTGEPWPIDYVMRPEFTCRVLTSLGNEDQEAKLDLHPTEGPTECIQIDIRRTTQKFRLNEKGFGVTDINRYWLDPKQNYIIKRWDMVMVDGAGKESIHSSHLIEETARSPQGIWYATKVRLKNAVTHQDATKGDQLYLIYVDFDADLPDSLFHPPTAGTKSRKLD